MNRKQSGMSIDSLLYYIIINITLFLYFFVSVLTFYLFNNFCIITFFRVTIEIATLTYVNEY